MRIACALLIAITAGIVGGSVAAGVAGLLAACAAILALGLPGLSGTGLAVGGLFVGAGILSWTCTDRPLAVWALLAVEAVLCSWWARPWLPGLRRAATMGTAWLGLSYWLLGIVGAALMLHGGVAAARVAYAGTFGVAVLAVLARSRRRDLSVGIAAAFLLALAVLMLAGSDNLFAAVHPVPHNDWGKGFQYRFWGASWLLYHPNSMAGIATLVAIRIGPDRVFAWWQRLAVTVLAGLIIAVTDSRTGWIFAAAAAVVHGVQRFRRPLVAAVPFVVLVLVLVCTGGWSFLAQERYVTGGVTSGRVDTWRQVLVDWEHAGWAGKTFGDASDARATVHRDSSGDGIELTVDNAAVGALRRGGVLGEVAFVFGLVLLLRRLRGREVPAWYVVAVLASIPTIATTEWLLGTTGGTLWILLVSGESRLMMPIPTTPPMVFTVVK